MKRLVLLMVLLGLLGVLAAEPPKASAGADINISITVRLSPVFVGLPMPGDCAAVPRGKKHYDASWTEYRVRHSIPTLIAFYRRHMPRHGWTVLVIGRSNMAWYQGKRKVEMVFWRAPGGYTVIAVREMKFMPPGQAKKGKKKP